MKIKEFADQKHLTQGAIYKAIGRAGYSAKQLTDRKGNLTGKGMALLVKLFSDDPEPESEPVKAEKPEDIIIAELRDRLREAQERAEKWERLYFELQDRATQEREAHREELRAAHVLAAQAQETISKLSMNPIRRLFSGKKKDIPSDGQIH